MIHMRILAVDYGRKRIGLATGDELGLTVRGITTLTSQGLRRDAHRLIEWAESIQAQTILVGLPLTLSGEQGSAALRVKKLIDQLHRIHDSFSVIAWDERLTTQAANQWMSEAGIRPNHRPAIRDQIAACLILEDYLSYQQRHDSHQ